MAQSFVCAAVILKIMSFFRNVLNKLFGNWSTPSNAWQNLSGQYVSNSTFVSDQNKDTFLFANNGLGNLISSLAARLTGAELTGAEREANKFSHDEAQLAFNRELEASNTAYQRKVADMQAAGINPMMAASSGVSLPSSSSVASVSPSAAAFQLGDILNLYRLNKLLPLEVEQAQANIAKTRADANKVVSDTKAVDITNKYLEESEQLRLEGIRNANRLSESQRDMIIENISKTKEEVKKLIAETKNEEEKRSLIIAQIAVENANVRRIAELLPFEQKLMDAQTSASRASAAAQFAQAAWQNGLISKGMIEIAVENAGYERDSAEYRSAVDRVQAEISGDKPIEGLSSVADMIVKSIGKVSNHMFPKILK